MVLAIEYPDGPDAYIVDEDNSGFDLQLAPKFNASIGGTYTHSLANGGTVVFNATYTYVDDLFIDHLELSHRNSVELLNASINYESPGDRYRVSLFGINLTDEIYVVSRTIVPPLFDYRNVSPPRMWGVELAWEL